MKLAVIEGDRAALVIGAQVNRSAAANGAIR
jgi:hypothetical protein